VRPDDHAGDEVAEYDRLLQSLEDDCCYGGRAENEREVLQERMGILHCGILARLQGPSLASLTDVTALLTADYCGQKCSYIRVILERNPIRSLNKENIVRVRRE